MKAQLKDKRSKKGGPMQKRDLCFFSFFLSSVKSSQDTPHITFMSGFVHVLPFARKKMVLHDMLSVIRVEQDSIEKHLLCGAELTPTNKCILLNHH